MLQVTPTVIITKRNTVNTENLTNQNVLLTTKKVMLLYKQDLLTYKKKDSLKYTKNPWQTATANSRGKFSQQIFEYAIQKMKTRIKRKQGTKQKL